MPVEAKVYRILIASPRDVEEEEKILGRDETKKTLKQLNFKKDSVSIVNNILLDTPITFEVEEDENYVEYYFELTIDDEIELPPQQNISTNTYQSNVKGGPFGVDC